MALRGQYINHFYKMLYFWSSAVRVCVEEMNTALEERGNCKSKDSDVTQPSFKLALKESARGNKMKLCKK